MKPAGKAGALGKTVSGPSGLYVRAGINEITDQLLYLKFFEDGTGHVTAKTKGIVEYIVHRSADGLAEYEVQSFRDFFIQDFGINGSRYDIVFDGQYADNAFNSACSAQQMTRH